MRWLAKKLRQRWRIAVGCYVVLLAPVVMLLYGKGETDPLYNGKRLSVWLRGYPGIYPRKDFGEDMQWRAPCKSASDRQATYRKYEGRKGRRKNGEEIAAAHEALIHCGPSAFPVLFAMIKGPHDWPILRNRVVEETRRWLELAEAIPVRGTPFFDRASAYTAFLDLQESGCDMRAAVIEIHKLEESSDLEISMYAKHILAALEAEKK